MTAKHWPGSKMMVKSLELQVEVPGYPYIRLSCANVRDGSRKIEMIEKRRKYILLKPSE